MAKRILILTSFITGHGHKSITHSIEKQINKLDPDVELKIVEGFDLPFGFGRHLGGLYGPIIRNAVYLWKLIWRLSSSHPGRFNNFTEKMIKNKLLPIIHEFQPDGIVSVHPCFCGSVMNVLQKARLDIPFVIVYADLISFSPLWVEPRATLNIIPTVEAQTRAASYGVEPEKIKVVSLPVREQIVRAANTVNMDTNHQRTRPRLLIMSGGEGSGNIKKIVRLILGNTECEVSVITGRNKRLKEELEKQYDLRYKERLQVFGFVENVEMFMVSHDVAITRGSPNVLMECINCGLPLIITGVLPGQEEGNVDFTLNNNLGLLCEDLTQLPKNINELFMNDWELQRKIRQNQLAYRDLKAADKIAKFIIGACFKERLRVS